MEITHWLYRLAAEIDMAPGFLAALDAQLCRQARQLLGTDDFVCNDHPLLPPDHGFHVQFLPASDGGVVGVIDGYLIDPTAFGHPVTFAWRAIRTPNQRVSPDQERDDLQFFWVTFPTAELTGGK